MFSSQPSSIRQLKVKCCKLLGVLPFACRICGQQLSPAQRQEVAAAVQRAQDAQTGYCSDYCAKNQPMAFHEVRELQKGHTQLHAAAMQRGEGTEKGGKRHAMRIMSDAYQKGIVRGQVENCNLRANHREECAVATERVSTATFQSFPGNVFLQTTKRHGDKEEEVGQPTALRTHGRRLRAFDWAAAYGHRPTRPGLWELSPYEFMMYWDVVPVTLPTRREEWLNDRGTTNVTLTAKGRAKLMKAKSDTACARLRPGVDYTTRKTATRRYVHYEAGSGPARLAAATAGDAAGSVLRTLPSPTPAGCGRGRQRPLDASVLPRVDVGCPSQHARRSARRTPPAAR